jgi:hypothetical protein
MSEKVPNRTPIDLYRAGNMTSPRLDQVRIGIDLPVRQLNGQAWVDPGRGGMSTFAAPSPFVRAKHWWRLPAGSEYDGALLFVWNDHGDHWSWEPAYTMLLSSYVAALAAVNAKFVKP